MKPNITEYLHFFIGCEVQHTDDYYQVTITKLSYFLAERWNENMKLILRPLDSMTEEEKKDFVCIPNTTKTHMIRSEITGISFDGNNKNCICVHWEKTPSVGYSAGTTYYYFNRLYAEQFMWLCKKGFDILDLHKQGLCLYRNKKGELY